MNNAAPIASFPTPSAGRPGAAASGVGRLEAAAMLVVSVLVVAASVFRWWSITITEALGFATGGACVWLIVRDSIWNWPIGLANNVLFFVLFLRSALFADMGLQVIYFAIGTYGWLNWAHGGNKGGRLAISRATRVEWVFVIVTVPAGTWLLREVLLAVNGAAPFWDSLTTMVSLVAQYLLSKKRLENWLFWILADIIYVPLYLSRALPLTAFLYGLFLVMCLIGLREWITTARESRAAA
jgi:nicotinamide mononucleotide transporter